jgi:hypothetical protein
VRHTTKLATKIVGIFLHGGPLTRADNAFAGLNEASHKGRTAEASKVGRHWPPYAKQHGGGGQCPPYGYGLAGSADSFGLMADGFLDCQ